jgi:hypothetical protein
MVRAILEGRKTQTRRIVTDKHFKRLGLERDGEYVYTAEGPQWDGTFEGGVVPWSPYGKPGDRLWVRETWCQAATDEGTFKYNSEGNLDNTCCHYRADGYEVMHIDGEETKSGKPKSPWVPSIHMPRWASRITLEITGVRVERLQDISYEDAELEGIERLGNGWRDYLGDHPRWMSSITSFQSLWMAINGHDSWNANPWVWVIEFKRAA